MKLLKGAPHLLKGILHQQQTGAVKAQAGSQPPGMCNKHKSGAITLQTRGLTLLLHARKAEPILRPAETPIPEVIHLPAGVTQHHQGVHLQQDHLAATHHPAVALVRQAEAAAVVDQAAEVVDQAAVAEGNV